MAVIRPAHLIAFVPGAGVSARQWGEELMGWADARNVEMFGSMDEAREYHRLNWPSSLALAPGMVEEVLEAFHALDAEAADGCPSS